MSLAATKDTGHHNCRDYHLPVPETPTAPSTSSILKLRAGQNSPLNKIIHRPQFRFLDLPYEIRRQIYDYLLPYTETNMATDSLARQKLNLPKIPHESCQKRARANRYGADTTLWHRGQTSLLCVNSQIHVECSHILYSTNIFVLFITYDMISFRFRWLTASRLAPSKAYDFMSLFGETKYLGLMRRLVVSVDHVDSYTGMIKYNVGGKGLTHGLKGQVRGLVQALRGGDRGKEEGLKMLTLRLIDGNAKGMDDVQTVLDPLRELRGLVEVLLYGAITEGYAEDLKGQMMRLKD